MMEAEAKEEAGKSKAKSALPPEPIKPSFQAKELLETLEFNEVDMYRFVREEKTIPNAPRLIVYFHYNRNDYPYVAKNQLPRYKSPHLKEAFCFINLSQSIGRYVSSVAWNPKYSSILLSSYTSNALCTQIDSKRYIVDLRKVY